MMFKKFRICLTGIALAALVLFVAGTALTAIIPQTVSDLSRNSNYIVRGEVLSENSQWNEEHNFIYTLITLRVNQTYKGSMKPAQEIQIWVPGGQIADTGLAVEHAAQFDIGQEVIIFLSDREEFYDVTSWEMGKFTVEQETVIEKNMTVTEFVETIKSAQR